MPARSSGGRCLYLYVTDDAQRLVGVISLRDLVFRRPERRIGDVMNRDVKFVRVDDDQEESPDGLSLPLLGLPVVDSENRLVGIVKASDALHVAQQEATEDMQLMVVFRRRTRADPVAEVIGRPCPGCISIGYGLSRSAVVSLFESTMRGGGRAGCFLPIVADRRKRGHANADYHHSRHGSWRIISAMDGKLC